MTDQLIVSLNSAPPPLELLDIDGARALDEIATWPGYRATPLVSLDGLTTELDIASLWYKDESPRFGVGSFKPMGAGLAVARVVARHVEQETGRPKITSAQLLAGTFRDLAEKVIVACATDGNHGRAVAWAARLFGCRAVVYVASHVSDFRCEAIAGYGAEVIKTKGNHDAAVDRVATDAKRDGWAVISETAKASDVRIAHDIFSGYNALTRETLSGLPDGEAPTHVFVQVGVGGLAGGCVHALNERYPDRVPKIVTVEAQSADALRRSIEAGHRVAVDGDLHTVMAGLAAGVISEHIWPVLHAGIFAATAIDDSTIAPAMKRLADPNQPVVIEAGESGVAGLAALMAIAADGEARAAVELTGSSRVLVFGTEGAEGARRI